MNIVFAVIVLFFLLSLVDRKSKPSAYKSDNGMFGFQGKDNTWVDEREILDIIDGKDVS